MMKSQFLKKGVIFGLVLVFSITSLAGTFPQQIPQSLPITGAAALPAGAPAFGSPASGLMAKDARAVSVSVAGKFTFAVS